ncbi:MAG: STAS domain-containing protein [SAR324 cluster bacterium]|nr:STAS domain-containing protein [SAR324 cluster bacterium]
MKLSHQIENEIGIIQVKGDITWQNAGEFRFYVQSLADDHPLQAIVVNLEQVTKIDSSGMGILYSLHKTSEKQNIRWMLCQVNNDAYEVMRDVGLDRAITLYKTVEEALALLKENP